MSQPTFGDIIRIEREKSKMGSRALARKAGKAETYVSQLERNLITMPSYDTAYKLLKALGLDEGEIKAILNGHGIKKPKTLTKETDQFDNIGANNPLLKSLDTETKQLKKINDEIHFVFDLLIQRDFSKAKNLLLNLHSLIVDNKQGYDFFGSLLQSDYHNLSDEQKEQILKTLKDSDSNGS